MSLMRAEIDQSFIPLIHWTPTNASKKDRSLASSHQTLYWIEDRDIFSWKPHRQTIVGNSIG